MSFGVFACKGRMNMIMTDVLPTACLTSLYSCAMLVSGQTSSALLDVSLGGTTLSLNIVGSFGFRSLSFLLLESGSPSLCIVLETVVYIYPVSVCGDRQSLYSCLNLPLSCSQMMPRFHTRSQKPRHTLMTSTASGERYKRSTS